MAKKKEQEDLDFAGLAGKVEAHPHWQGLKDLNGQAEGLSEYKTSLGGFAEWADVQTCSNYIKRTVDSESFDLSLETQMLSGRWTLTVTLKPVQVEAAKTTETPKK